MITPWAAAMTQSASLRSRSAANSFIDEIAAQNAAVKDAAKQHQVAIVKFAGSKTDKVGNDTYRDGQYWYNYSQVMKTLAPCTNDTKGAFSSQVNAIEPAGATNAAAGLELAKGQAGRSDAKKVVIFFTDGTPTTRAISLQRSPRAPLETLRI